jgi:hypothetical protein
MEGTKAWALLTKRDAAKMFANFILEEKCQKNLMNWL